jgi:phosphohistidine phosphatase
MEILLIRHGDAVEDAPGLGDGGRWLTGWGRRVTREVGTWLAAHPKHRPAEIWTSPLVRAVQTAEILAGAVDLTDDLSVLPDLSTSGSPREVLRRVAHYRGEGPLALVGHEPSLSTLAVTLLGGAVRWPGFKKSAVLGVKWQGHGEAEFRFLLDPKTLQAVRDVDAIG